MVFVNLFLFIIAFFFISASLSGHGKVITYKKNFDFFENIFFGFISLALINTKLVSKLSNLYIIFGIFKALIANL